MKKFLFVALWLFSSIVAFSQSKNKVNLESPFSTIYTQVYFLDDETYDARKASYVVRGESRKDAEKIAIKIKQVIVGRGVKFNFDDIPKDPNYLDTISDVDPVHKYTLFPKELPEIYLEKIKGKWYYGKETNNEIDRLYNEVYPVGTDYVRSVIPPVGHEKFLELELWQYVGILFYLLLSVCLFYLLRGICFYVLKKSETFLFRRSHDSLEAVIKRMSRPLTLILVSLLIKEYLPLLGFKIVVNMFVFSGIRIAETVFWIFVFLNLIEVIMTISRTYSSGENSKLDDQLRPFVRKLLRSFVVFLGVLKMLTIFGADIATVIAGVSIGGIAVALAAQDTVKNLIGTFMIFFDQPFQIGDWIEGAGIVGTVEEVGFRSSRIRSADTSIYSIPNSKLSEIVIENMGLRQFRRYKTKLGIRYDTPPELIEAFVKGIRKLIEVHPATRTDSYNVEFTGFGESSLDILLNVYFINPSWGVEQSSKHTLHIAILKFAKELGVEFAFPSQTVMMENTQGKNEYPKSYDLKNSNLETIVQSSVEAFKESFKTES